jgi:hypothetical protein
MEESVNVPHHIQTNTLAEKDSQTSRLHENDAKPASITHTHPSIFFMRFRPGSISPLALVAAFCEQEFQSIWIFSVFPVVLFSGFTNRSDMITPMETSRKKREG